MFKKEHKTKEVSQVEVHEVKRRVSIGKREIIVLGSLLGLCVIAGVVLIVLHKNSKSNPPDSAQLQKIEDEKRVAESDYTVLTKDEIAEKVKNETGLTSEQLQKKPVDSSVYKNFDSAYAAAKAYYGLGSYDKSVQAYAIAVKYANNNTSYIFYFDYSAAADGVNDGNLAVSMLNKAKEAISASNMDDTQKKTLIESIDQKIHQRALNA